MIIKVGFTRNNNQLFPDLPEGVKNYSIVSEDIQGGTVTIIDLDVKAQNDNAAFIAESKKTDTLPDAAVIE